MGLGRGLLYTLTLNFEELCFRKKLSVKQHCEFKIFDSKTDPKGVKRKWIIRSLAEIYRHITIPYHPIATIRIPDSYIGAIFQSVLLQRRITFTRCLGISAARALRIRLLRHIERWKSLVKKKWSFAITPGPILLRSFEKAHLPAIIEVASNKRWGISNGFHLHYIASSTSWWRILRGRGSWASTAGVGRRHSSIITPPPLPHQEILL